MLAGKIGREVTLRNALRDLKREQDMILIDCPPTLGLLTVNALVAATHALLSTEAQYFSLQGIEQAVRGARPRPRQPQPRARAARRRASTSPTCAPSTPARRSRRFASASATKVFRTVIRQSIAYAESAERAVPILDYRPDRGADYLSLAGEMLRRLGMHGAARRASTS